MPENYTYQVEVYKNLEWLDGLAYTDEWNIRAILAALAVIGPVATFMDVGCGRGILVDFMGRVVGDTFRPDVASYGIELFRPPYVHAGSVLKGEPNDLIFIHDLREPLPEKLDGIRLGQYNLVTSWEVGEHLPEDAALVYCETLRALTEKWLIFTAAIPGQGGDHHINEQPKEWWRERIEDDSLRYNEFVTEQLAGLWNTLISPSVALTGPCFWLPQNVQVFERD